MRSRKKLLQESKLYLILDAQVNTHDELFDIASQAVRGGVHIFQLRDKLSNAKDIMALSRKLVGLARRSNTLFILNDRPDLALAVGADGVHLGQDDIPVSVAKKFLGYQFLIGKSCQNKKHLQQAQQECVDYVGFGSVYQTKTKPGRRPLNINNVAQVIAQAKIPVFAIGGISLKCCAELTAVGIKRMAVCRAISESENPKKETEQFIHLINSRG